MLLALLGIAVVVGAIWFVVAMLAKPLEPPIGTPSMSATPVTSSSVVATSSPKQSPALLQPPVIILTYAPAGAVVTLDGKQIVPVMLVGNRIGVDPGEHTLTVKMTGFDTYAKTFTLEDGDTLPVNAMLESNSEETKDYYSEHEEEGKVGEWITSKEIVLRDAIDDGKIPFDGIGYRIEYVEPGIDWDEYYLLVICDPAVLSRAECKLEARAALSSESGPYLWPDGYRIVYQDKAMK